MRVIDLDLLRPCVHQVIHRGHLVQGGEPISLELNCDFLVYTRSLSWKEGIIIDPD